jgi:hypothetical protein
MHRAIRHRGLYIFIFVPLLVLGVETGAAFAQMGGRPPGGAGPGSTQGMSAPPPCKPERPPEIKPEAQTERVNKQLDALRQQLALTPDASGYFNDFAAKLRAFTVDEEKRRSAPKALSISTLGRMGTALDDSRNQYAALEDVYASAKRLYDTLDESGRKAFDQLALPTDTPGSRRP